MTVRMTFEEQCRMTSLMEPVTEFVFAPPRRWRMDYCWPEKKVALEVEGGVWIAGRHNRGSGFLKDMEKYNRAAMLGYRVFKCTPKEIKNGQALTMMQEALR